MALRLLRLRPMETQGFVMDVELAVKLKISASTLRSWHDDLFWIEQRPDLEGRSVVVTWTADGEPEVISPEGYSFSSRLHEYGGGAMEVIDDDGPVIVAITKDQTLVAFRPQGEARLIAQDLGHLGDLRWVPGTQIVLAVRERSFEESVQRSIIAVDVATCSISTLLEGRDFFADIAVGPHGEFACSAWDHPNMPWDAAELLLGHLDLEPSIRLGDIKEIAGGLNRSAVHPTFVQDRLVFAAEDGEWSRVVTRGGSDGSLTWAPSDGYEHAVPLWVVGRRQFVGLGDEYVGIARYGGFSHVQREHGETVTTQDDVPEELCATSQGFAWMGSASDALGVVVRHDAHGNEISRRVLGPGVPPEMAISKPLQVAAPSRHGGLVHGLLYVPFGVESPAVVVACHGGPTACSEAGFNPIVQCFTSRGFAVLLANYGGSTGHGAAYRRKLDGQWGLIDVDDCVDLLQGLGEQGLVNASRAGIRGSSAGGYTTLLAMCTGAFLCGVSHYGVAELTSLATATHDFESRYMDRLVGPLPESAEVYRERSAVTRAGEMRGEVLLLQGLDDPVVPPSQAQAMRDALVANGQPVELVQYEGESHGFRREDTLIDSISREIEIFERVLLAPDA